MKTRILAVLLAASLSATGAAAQTFLFSSDRLGEGAEIFLYDEGSEIRITRTAGVLNYVPFPSPDGARVLIAAGVPDRSGHRWEYQVIDLASGRVLSSHPMPGVAGQAVYPAGGLRGAWLPDGRGFLGYGRFGDEWRVLFFQPGEPPVDLATGYPFRLAPDGATIAYARAGIVYARAIAGGAERTVAGGELLSWTPDSRGLLVERGGAVALAWLDGSETGLVSYPGRVIDARLSPDGRLLALLREEAGSHRMTVFLTEGTTVVHPPTTDFELRGAPSGIGWLDQHRFVYQLVLTEGSGSSARIVWTIAVQGERGRGVILVRSIGGDYDPVPFAD